MYAIVMRRWGESDTHAYLLGVWESREEAIQRGMSERERRGNKYEPFLNELASTGYASLRYVIDESGTPVHVKKHLDKIENDDAVRCLCEFTNKTPGRTWVPIRNNDCPVHRVLID